MVRSRSHRGVRPGRSDVTLTAVFAVHSVIATFSATPLSRPGAIAAGLVLGVFQVGPLLVRRTHPVSALTVVTATIPLQYGLAVHPGGWSWLIVVYSVCVYCRPLVAGAALAAVLPLGLLGMVAIFGTVHPGGLVGALPDAAVALEGSVFYLVCAAALGLAVHADRRRSRRRRDTADRARMGAELERERARIQADLVTALGRDLRRTVDLASAAAGRNPDDPDVDRALADLRDQARRALEAIRRLLGTLRRTSEEGPAAPAAPSAPSSAVRPTPSGLAIAGGVVVVGVAAPLLFRDAPALPEIIGLTDADRPLTVALVVSLVLQALPFAWWRSAPIPAVLAAGALGAVAVVLRLTHDVVSSVGLLLYYSAAVTPRRWVSLLAVLLSAAVPTLVAARFGTGSPGTEPAELLIIGIELVGLWALGTLHFRSSRREDAERAIHTARDLRESLIAERRRIARELHDVLGHHLSAITIHARVAVSARGSDPDAFAQAIEDITGCAAEIERALPSITGGLEPAAPDTVLTEADIRQLTAALEADGAPVSVTVHGTPPHPGADEVDLFALRILQEAITNIGRHARRSRTTITVSHLPGLLELEIRNHRAAELRTGHRARDTARPTSGPGGGNGLVGMRERVALLRGDLAAGPGPDRTWLVHARLPRGTPGDDPGGSTGGGRYPDPLDDRPTSAGPGTSRSDTPTTAR